MNFKSVLGAVSAFVITMSFSSIVEAALINRGNGMIYDNVLDITWLQDANYAQSSGYDADGLMSWNAAVTWAQQLEYGGFDQWRLPTVNPQVGSDYNYTWSLDGTSDYGFNNTSPQSELAYMYYVNLNGQGQYSPSGALNTEFGLGTTGLFLSVYGENYWSGNFYEPTYRIDTAFLVRFGTGEQHVHGVNGEFYGWAVHDGDIGAVPVPAAVWLFGSGLMGLIGFAKRKTA